MAACNNRNIFTCPASLDNVIGVKCDTSGKLKETEYIYNSFPLDGIDVTACGIHDLVKYSGESKITSACNSFATPAITALVYNIIKNNPNIGLYGLKEVLNQNSAHSKQIEVSSYITNKSQKIKNYNNYIDNSIEIPIIEVYNNYGNKITRFYKNLTEKFRVDGYNAICICTEEADKDLCNGLISIYSHLNDGKMSFDNIFFVKRIKLICSIYDPDIIIVPIDMTDDNRYVQLKDVESDLEADIKINIYENLDIEVMSTNENDENNENYQTKKFNKSKAFTSDAKQIDDIYNYILNLFETNKERTDTYET